MSKNISLEPIHTEPAYRVAAASLRTKILSGEINVGEVLPSETSMAELLGVNRSTIREAIRLLEENGIVARKPGGKKLFVTVPQRSELSNRMTAAMILQKIKIDELYRTMLILEPPIAVAASKFATDAQILALEENVLSTETNLSDNQAVLELDVEFHDLLCEASNNRAIQLCRDPISDLFYPAFSGVIKSLNASERLLAAHKNILEALKNGDAGVAEEWMKRHIEDFRRGYELANLDIETPVTRFPVLGDNNDR